MFKDLGILITEGQKKESERIRKVLEELEDTVSKQRGGYYSDGGGFGYYSEMHPFTFYTFY